MSAKGVFTRRLFTGAFFLAILAGGLIWYFRGVDVGYAVFQSGVNNAETMTLYEGLPHPTLEPSNLYESESKGRELKKIQDALFYFEELHPRAAHATELKELVTNSSSFKPFSGAKPSGFHPDYCLEWKKGSSTYQVLFCFTCNQALITAPAVRLRFDLATDQFKAILKQYRNKRPSH